MKKQPEAAVIPGLGGLRDEVTAMTLPVVRQVESLSVETAEDYALADVLLTKIAAARAFVKTRIDKILKPAKETVKELNSFLHELDDPLEAREQNIRGQMKTYKQAELERKWQADKEAERLRQEAEEKQRLADAAKTKAMQTRLTNQATQLEVKAAVTEASFQPTVAAGSGTRVVRLVAVNNLKVFLQAIISGEVPADTVSINAPVLNSYHKESPEIVEKWPGVEAWDDVRIVRR